jgi:hypothetical protein
MALSPDRRLREQYQGIIEMPSDKKAQLEKLLMRDGVTAPLQGSRMDQSVLTNRASCRNAALWLVGGTGRTAPADGKETFHLKDRTCPVAVPGLDLGSSGAFVLLDSYYLVATPSGGQPVILTVTTERTEIPLANAFYLVDINNQNRSEIDFKVTVQSLGLNGKPLESSYHWHCLVEVGMRAPIPG